MSLSQLYVNHGMSTVSKQLIGDNNAIGRMCAVCHSRLDAKHFAATACYYFHANTTRRYLLSAYYSYILLHQSPVNLSDAQIFKSVFV